MQPYLAPSPPSYPTHRHPGATPAGSNPAREPIGNVDGVRRWPDHLLQWGVARRSWSFDIEDPALHRGLVQHAFVLGRDHLAICGWETPLKRSFQGPRQPLLALAGPDNPRCPACLARTVPAPPFVPHVSPYASEHRSDGRTWLDDRLDALGVPAPRTPRQGLRPVLGYRIDPAWPAQDIPLQLGPGRLPEPAVDASMPALVVIDSSWTEGAPELAWSAS
jgi:hypothetical protein